MSFRGKLTHSAILLLTALLAGCSSSPGTIVGLPWHQIDTSARPAGAKAPGNSDASPEWAAADCRPWRYIVIHHSASERGNAAAFDAEHRANGWDGLGYHFVIDNGDGGADGLVEVGERWRIQKWGAHTGGTPDNAYNKYGIGICLVGNFNAHGPTRAQLASLERLVSYLCRRYDIAPRDVIGHRDAPGAHTECPGDVLHAYIHGTLQSNLSRQVATK